MKRLSFLPSAAANLVLRSWCFFVCFNLFLITLVLNGYNQCPWHLPVIFGILSLLFSLLTGAGEVQERKLFITAMEDDDGQDAA